MSSAKKMLLSAAGNAGGATDVADVFSTFLYTGNDTARSITNGIDLAGEGGLVWLKSRSAGGDNYLIDTERGGDELLISNNTNASATVDDYPVGNGTRFDSTGFSIGPGGAINGANVTRASWTFRKAPKFFDIVTYTGDGNATLINHNLGSVPGMIIVKCTSEAGPSWPVFHRALDGSAAQDYVIHLRTNAARADGGNHWYNFAPTATQFKVGPINDTNTDGFTYVAYIFAHNDGDGEFGPDGDQDIISCGSYTGNGTTTNAQTEQNGPTIDLGWEPQFVIIKNASATGEWYLFDTVRGFSADFSGAGKNFIYPNKNNAETSLSADYAYLKITSTGFKITAGAGAVFNGNNESYIYMAIRAPMITPPAAATEVFKGYSMTGLNANAVVDIDFPPDMVLHIHALGGKYILTRLLGSLINTGSAGSSKRNWLKTNGNDALDTGSHGIYYNNDNTSLTLNSNYGGASNADITSFQWKRAKGFFDVVSYTGTGGALNVSHSLGVAPEMIWVKNRVQSDSWAVYYGNNEFYLTLNDNGQPIESANYWNDTSPTSSVFTVKNNHMVGASGETYIAYLFATLAGISKVGSVSHSGSSTDVDCGFSNGARFVLLKRTDAAGHWYVFDTISGIIAGNDPYYILDFSTTIGGINYATQITNSDFVDPLSSGFQISGDFADGDYIFYAIA